MLLNVTVIEFVHLEHNDVALPAILKLCAMLDMLLYTNLYVPFFRDKGIPLNDEVRVVMVTVLV